jgi:general secretion pathway protein A
MSNGYLQYYNLTEAPFTITPNPRFLYQSAKHREALNHLVFGITERKGFVQLTGEVGSGKTTLCRALLEQLPTEQYSTALILNPALNPDQMMAAIATEFGLDVRGKDRFQILQILNFFLLEEMAKQRDVVLIIDEAQNLTNELLEQVRLISNLETDNQKLLQIVLMGQPELRDRLNEHSLRQLRQRITVRYHLTPLGFTEVKEYIQHRLHVSGANGSPYFSAGAIWRVFKYSKGIPRLVNAVCDKCLLAGFVSRKEHINFGMAGRAIRELEGAFAA